MLLIFLFYFVYKLGHGSGSLRTLDWVLKWQIWAGPVGPDGAGLGFLKKTCLLNGAGSGIKKPGLNPTRCHS